MWIRILDTEKVVGAVTQIGPQGSVDMWWTPPATLKPHEIFTSLHWIERPKVKKC